MSESEAEAMGVGRRTGGSTSGSDDAKVNIAPPSASTTDWMKIVGVNLGNGDATYPSGTTSRPPSLNADIRGPGERGASGSVGRAIAGSEGQAGAGEAPGHADVAATILGDMLGWSPQKVKAAVADLIKDKLAGVVDGKDDKGHDVQFLRSRSLKINHHSKSVVARTRGRTRGKLEETRGRWRYPEFFTPLKGVIKGTRGLNSSREEVENSG